MTLRYRAYAFGMPKGLKFTNGVARNPATGRYHVRVMTAGRVIQKVLPTKRSAEALVRDLKVEKVRASLGLGPSVTGATIKQVTTTFIEEAEARGVMDSTAGRYRRVAKILNRVLGPQRSARLANADIARFVATRRSEGVSGRTIQAELSLLRTFVRGTVGPAFIEWVTPTLYDPQQAAPKPIPTDTEIAGLLWTLRDQPPWYRVILLGLLTALRPSDVLAVGPAHLQTTDSGDPILAVPMQKRRGQVLALPVVPRLWTVISAVDSGTFGPTVTTYQSFQSGLRHHTRTLTTPWNGIQALRRTAATWASEAGFTDDQVGLLLGHKVRGMAREHYIRPAADPWIPVRREMLGAVAARLKEAEASFEIYFGAYEKHTPETLKTIRDKRRDSLK